MFQITRLNREYPDTEVINVAVLRVVDDHERHRVHLVYLQRYLRVKIKSCFPKELVKPSILSSFEVPLECLSVILSTKSDFYA